MILFDEIGGQIYRGHLIKRHDIVYAFRAENQSLKAHVDGTISRTWVRNSAFDDDNIIVIKNID